METSHMPVRSRPSPADGQHSLHHADSNTPSHAQSSSPDDNAVRPTQQSASLSSQPPHEPIAAPSFPETPTAELPPIQPHHERTSSTASHTLPSLSSVTNGLQPNPESRPAPIQWPSLNPYTVYYSPGYAQTTETASRPVAPMNAAASPHERSGSVSLDDPDVQIAAEALAGLGASLSSPPNRSTPLPTPPRDLNMSTDKPQSEPLLSLITASHPLLATTIEGATSAYNQSKNYSPHLKTGVEYVEGCLTPVAKAVNNIGQRTGVHTSVRWWFTSRRQGRKHQSSTDIESGERSSYKRRKAARPGEGSDLEARSLGMRTPELPSYTSDRRTSVSTIDTLPPYDENRSPAYAEAVDSGAAQPELAWKTKIVVSTSSLGIALRDNNLPRLRYCVDGLRGAHTFVTAKLAILQDLVDENAAQDVTNDDPETHSKRINEVQNAIVGRIRDIFNLVNNYAGGALPNNAESLIRDRILNLPARYFRSTGQNPGSTQQASVQDGASRVIVLAKEVLQTINQVSDVIDRTIHSAEEWLEAMGRSSSGVQVGSLPNGTVEKAPATEQWATTQSQHAAPPADDNVPMTDRGEGK